MAMGAIAVILSGDQVNSIVLGAAEASARKLDLIASPGFLSRLLNAALPYLNNLNQRGELDDKRGEIEAATDGFVVAIAEYENLRPGTELTAEHMSSALSWFCEKFPNFVPFCTND
jgi:hypothetical protein